MEHAQRGGHIPGANNIPWATAVNDADGTFKAVEELKQNYEPKGVTPDKDVICYCTVGPVRPLVLNLPTTLFEYLL